MNPDLPDEERARALETSPCLVETVPPSDVLVRRCKKTEQGA